MPRCCASINCRQLAMPLLFHVLLVAVSLVASDGEPTAGDAYNASTCPKLLTCGDGVDIHYPFYRSDGNTTTDGADHSYCGYPGMAIACVRGHPVLSLSNGSYRVLNIDYGNNTVSLADTAALDGVRCPRVSHNVTIPPLLASLMKFPSSNTDNLTFFLNCTFTPDIAKPPGIEPISCRGFDGGAGLSYVLPPPDVPTAGRGGWPRACEEAYAAPVLRDSLWNVVDYSHFGDDGYVAVLRQGFQLVWDPSAGPCFQCEESKGRCSYNHTGGFMGCLCSDGRVRNPDCDSLAAGNSTLGDAINGGFAVRWNAGMGWCSDCEASGGRCGYNANSPDDQTCYCPYGLAIGSCSSGGNKAGKTAIIIGTSVAAGFLFLLFLVVSFLYIRKRRQYKMTSSSRLLKYTASGGTPRSRGSRDMESGSVHNLHTHHFAYEELEEATEGFNDTRELGDGGFGTVYKGHLRDGRVVAVKRLYNNSCRHVEQFVNEAAILSLLRHPNLVTFYGCTSSRSRELLLVYEFVSNGTVADHLHGHRAPERALSWPLRLNIAVEAAAALAYLHAVEPPVVHRDVKTNNILLDADFHVKVADFGLSRLFPLDATHVSTAPQGTPGYVDPEYHQCYQLTDKSDVYSFGVVLVELISSKAAVDVTRDRNEINLAGMAINKIQGCQVDQLVDHELGYSSDQATRRMMTMVAELAFRCLQQNGEMRPPIREVLEVLRGIQDGGFKEEKSGGKKDALVVPCSPVTVHAPWDSMSTTPSISQ